MAAQRRHRGRRRSRGRFGFLYALLSVLLIAAALLVGSMVFFRVDSILVEGQERYSAEEVIAAAQVERGDNLFRLHPARVAQRIQAALPYVREVSVRPAPPDTLVITVRESRAAVSLWSGESWFLMDARGKLVEQGGEALRSKAAPVSGLTPLIPSAGSFLEVEKSERSRLDALVGLLTALEQHELLEKLDSVDLRASNTVSFGFADRFTVEVPLSCDFDYKIQALAYVMEHLEENETGLIDLTRTDPHFIPN